MVRLNGGTVYTSTSRVNAAKVHEKYLQTAPSARLVEVPAGSTVEAEERKQV
jgi:hypothetical protein